MWSPLTSDPNRNRGNNRNVLYWLAALIICLICFGPDVKAAHVCAVDEISRKVCVSSPVKRVISLAPSLTELVFSLGAGPLLVGRSARCDFPREALKITPVGAYMKPDLERIVSLNPDLVLVTKPGARDELVSRLDSLGIPVYVSNSEKVDDIFKLILNLGILLSRKPVAEALVRGARAELEMLEQSIADTQHPTVLVAVGVRPLFVAGGRSFIGSLIRKAGGRNIAEHARVPFLRYSTEEVLARDPDFILTLNKDCADELECWNEWKRFSNLSAVQNRKVVTLDADTIARPSLRIVAAMKMLTQILHPGLKLGCAKEKKR